MKQSAVRQALIVARHELADGFRSRRALVVLVLYLAGSGLAMNGFVSALKRMEVQLSEILQVAPSSSTGVVADALWKSRDFRRMVSALVRDKEVAETLFDIPPVALPFAWLVMVFTPILVMLTTSTRIAEEVAHGSARLVWVRTSRLSWCTGKYIGQVVLTLLALALSTVCAWAIVVGRLEGVDKLEYLRAMSIFSVRAWILSVCAVGIALGVSQVTRRPNQATALALLLWFGLRFLTWLAGHYEGPGWARIWAGVAMITPHGHWSDLWRMSLPQLVSASAFLVSIGIASFLGGYAVLQRRNL